MSQTPEQDKTPAPVSKGEHNNMPFLVSIIMPVYNRARFLQQAADSIRSQSYTHWELIVVDDGSTDESVSLIKALSENFAQAVIIIEQENGGPAAARNTGIKQASGDFIAFFDSDDVWMPHHLTRCLEAFSNHPELSWVYAACERVDYFTQTLIKKSTFYTDDQQNKLFNIATREKDGVYILASDDAVLVQLNEGLDNGLQNSMLKKQVFEAHLIPDFRVGEDRLFILMALKSGFQMGFIDDIHVRYHVHDENISDTNKGAEDYQKRIGALKQLIDAKKALVNLVDLNADEYALYKDKLAKEIFWELGYALYQSSGDYRSAQGAYLEAIRLSPLTLRFYKTLMISLLKRMFKP